MITEQYEETTTRVWEVSGINVGIHTYIHNMLRQDTLAASKKTPKNEAHPSFLLSFRLQYHPQQQPLFCDLDIIVKVWLPVIYLLDPPV